MKTLVNVRMLLLLLVVILSSGCSTKTVYIQRPCLTEKPERPLKNTCGLIKSDFEFMKCVAENDASTEGYISLLEAAFDSCK